MSSSIQTPTPNGAPIASTLPPGPVGTAPSVTGRLTPVDKPPVTTGGFTPSGDIDEEDRSGRPAPAITRPSAPPPAATQPQVGAGQSAAQTQDAQKLQQLMALIMQISNLTNQLNQQIMDRDYDGANQSRTQLADDYKKMGELLGGNNPDMSQSSQQLQQPINGANYTAPSTAGLPGLAGGTPQGFQPSGGMPAGYSPNAYTGAGAASPSAATADAKQNAQIVAKVAKEMGVDPVTAVATMLTESGGNARSVGDHGTSFGLFQLHRGGELGSMSPQQAFDPETNARTALAEFKKNQGRYSDPGQLAAASQRPADRAGYARKVDANLAQARSLLAGT